LKKEKNTTLERGEEDICFHTKLVAIIVNREKRQSDRFNKTNPGLLFLLMEGEKSFETI